MNVMKAQAACTLVFFRAKQQKVGKRFAFFHRSSSEINNFNARILSTNKALAACTLGLFRIHRLDVHRHCSECLLPPTTTPFTGLMSL